jgi:hypothetical protein
MKITLFPEMRLNNITTTTRRDETTKIHIELQLERDRDEEEKEIRNIKKTIKTILFLVNSCIEKKIKSTFVCCYYFTHFGYLLIS